MKNEFSEKIKKCYYEKTGYMPSKFLLGYLTGASEVCNANLEALQKLIEDFRPYAKENFHFLDGPSELERILFLDLDLKNKLWNKPELEHRLRNNKYIKKYQKSIVFVDFENWDVDLSKENRNILQCYYISGTYVEDDKIKKLAMKQLKSGCKEAIFYCPHPNELQSKWHTLFDDVQVYYHLENNIEITEKNVLMTSDYYDGINSFIQEIESTARAIDDKEDVIYVFYNGNDDLGNYISYSVCMMELDAISLDTPLCSFWLEDSEQKKIPFNIIPTYNPNHLVYIDGDPEKAILTKCCKTSTIVIDAYDLEIGKTYYLKCSKSLDWIGSRKRLVKYGRTDEDKTLAIGIPNLNESEKDDACIDGLEIDKSILQFYKIEQADANTFSIELLDRTANIELNVAWIWNIKDHMSDYEAAVTCWVQKFVI